MLWHVEHDVGVRRAPQVTTWGWNAGMVARTQTPTLMITGQHDKQVLSERVRELYADLASREMSEGAPKPLEAPDRDPL